MSNEVIKNYITDSEKANYLGDRSFMFRNHRRRNISCKLLTLKGNAHPRKFYCRDENLAPLQRCHCFRDLGLTFEVFRKCHVLYMNEKIAAILKRTVLEIFDMCKVKRSQCLTRNIIPKSSTWQTQISKRPYLDHHEIRHIRPIPNSP